MENRSDIIRLLSTLLSTRESVEKRKQVLSEEFNIPMTRDIEQEVNEMCNLGLAVEMSGVQQGLQRGIQQGLQQGLQRGIQQGAQQTSIKNIRSLMRTLALSAKQAMEALEIPEAEQAQLMEKL